MPERRPERDEAEIDLTRKLRAAIDPAHLDDVLRAAGAPSLKGQAGEVLGETTAAQAAPLLVNRRFELPATAREPSGKLVDAAKAAIDPAEIERLGREADLEQDQALEVTAREMARIAQAAVDFARSEDRPVCHNCTAIGSARSAAELGPMPGPAQR